MLNGLYDVVLKTANTKKLTKFYSETLGFPIHHDCPECTVLDLKNNQWLVLQKDKKFKPVKTPKTLRSAFGFKVQDIDGVYTELKAKKVKFATTPTDQDWGARTTTAYDPDGNAIDLIQEKPELFDSGKYGAKQETPKEERETVTV